ncbi:MAG: YfiR family protein [Gemmatimonadetes bacterium]|jgi:hypothetical protein|nr:YfiR family protein [Gemmatimonadota bacterium]
MRVSKLLLILLLNPVILWAQIDANEEARLAKFKAVFIYNFVEFVKWPETKNAGSITIGVVSNSFLLPTLEAVARKRKASGEEIVIKKHVTVNDTLIAQSFPSYHILFVGPALTDELGMIAESLAGKHVLIIGDTDGFAKKGVAVNFILIDGKLKFEINTKALSRAGLEMHSQLLKLGILVE